LKDGQGAPMALHLQGYSIWRIEPTKILTRRELASVLPDLHDRAQRSESARLNLVIFRLACCCGLRASEIASWETKRAWVDYAFQALEKVGGKAEEFRGRQVR
jgi:integrase